MNAVVAIVLVNVILVSYVWSAIKEERVDERVDERLEKSSEKSQDERPKRSVSPRKRTAKEIKGE